ncbi:MAG: aminoacyl-tRNA hydrolase [Aureibaculum sp.]
MKILTLLKSFFSPKKDNHEDMKKYLIVGLGNIGEKYEHTRHNIGFTILDEIADLENVIFEPQKLGSIAKFRFKGRLFIMLKPATYMNLSGKAVKYWIAKEKIPLENLLIICDDLNIPFGTIRLKAKGSAGGHNGLLDINESLQTQNYPRFRFGVGDAFKKGNQVDYVLGKWEDDENKKLPERLKKSYELVKSFGTSGMANTMSDFNGK